MVHSKLVEELGDKSSIGKVFTGKVIADCNCQIGKAEKEENGNIVEEYYIIRRGVIIHRFDGYNQARVFARDLFGIIL